MRLPSFGADARRSATRPGYLGSVRYLDDALHPRALAERQLARDHARTADRPVLFARKAERMRASPLAFLRGAAPLFYEILSLHREIADGPSGEGWLVGDLHIENFGAYEPGPWGGPREPRPATFDVNDFDEAFVGPLRIDLLRLSTSLLVGSRELGTTGAEALELARKLLSSYVDAAFRGAPVQKVPPPVERLVARATKRSFRDLAKRYLEPDDRRLRRGTKLLPLDARSIEDVDAALVAYRKNLGEEGDRLKKPHCEVLDCAFRVAGTGSLGTFRVAALVAGKDHPWLFDLKQQSELSAGELYPQEPMDPASRVLAAYRASIASPPALIGTTMMGARSMLVRRLAEEEDKLELSALRPADLPALAAHLGALVGRAHARATTKPPVGRWTAGDLEHLLDAAIELAGIHEAAYLAYCRISVLGGG